MLLVPGVRWAVARAGIRQSSRDDVAVLECAPDTNCAAVFTQNQFYAAPVLVAREHLQRRQPRVFVVNSGCANAGTGQLGVDDARRICTGTAAFIGVDPEQVLPFSTGVIGERLPVTRMLEGIGQCVQRLRPDAWEDAARAIMTTDTVPKGATARIDVDGQPVTVTGIAKGVGMIRPDMATMLAFLATDAAVEQSLLQNCLRWVVGRSFNRITVDGDTSTNDACVLLATGAAGNSKISSPHDPAYDRLAAAVCDVARKLAQAVVRDAEGATKYVTLNVVGGASEEDCLSVAYTIAHSPLVKTAFFASDPNWGRLLAAVGRAGVAGLDFQKVRLVINGLEIFDRGAVAAAYREELGQAAMAPVDLRVTVDLGMGDQQAEVWTCDLSNEYVRINAEYRS